MLRDPVRDAASWRGQMMAGPNDAAKEVIWPFGPAVQPPSGLPMHFRFLTAHDQDRDRTSLEHAKVGYLIRSNPHMSLPYCLP